MITVKYSCAECGLNDREVQVPARATEATDVCHWVGVTVAQCVSDDHSRISPSCRSDKASMLKIPMPKEAEFIGQQIE